MKSLKLKCKKSVKNNLNFTDYDPNDKLDYRHNSLRKALVLLGPEKLIKILSKLSKKETNKNSKTFTNISKDKIWVQKNYSEKFKNKNIKRSKRSKRCKRGAIV
jgi:hypothetical protein